MWWEILQLSGFWISGLCFGFALTHFYYYRLSKKPKKDPLKLWKKLYKEVTGIYKAFQTIYCGAVDTPIVIPKENMDRILNNLEPLRKKNLEAEQKKDDYWWKVQKYRNQSLSKYPVDDLFATRTN